MFVHIHSDLNNNNPSSAARNSKSLESMEMSISKRVDEITSGYSYEYYMRVKTNEIRQYRAIWIYLGNMILSGKSMFLNIAYSMMSFLSS